MNAILKLWEIQQEYHLNIDKDKNICYMVML
jgi:hypothetical protein